MSQLVRHAVALTILATGSAVPRVAAADDVGHKRQEAAQVAAQLESLQNQAFDLGGEFDKAEQQLGGVTAAVATAERKLATLESQVGTLRSSARHLAIDAYMSGGATQGLLTLIGARDGPTDAIPRDQYTSLVLGTQSGAIDKLGAVSEDAARQRDELKARLDEQQTLQNALRDRQAQVKAALAKYNALQAKVTGQLADLVAAEQARRASATVEKARRDAERERRTAAASTNRRSAGRPASRAAAKASTPARSSGPTPGANVPAPSPGAGGAVAAAMSQLGVPYRFAAASPGAAFDCSGLTSWAWAQAGVYLPHQSRAQAAMLPHISREQIQPGDLIFYYSPIGHVAMYIGNGQLVHATRPGDVVKVAVARWDRVAVIGRPG